MSPEKIYRGDEGDFKITFTAAGPIYDVDTGNDGLYEDDHWKTTNLTLT